MIGAGTNGIVYLSTNSGANWNATSGGGGSGPGCLLGRRTDVSGSEWNQPLCLNKLWRHLDDEHDSATFYLHSLLSRLYQTHRRAAIQPLLRPQCRNIFCLHLDQRRAVVGEIEPANVWCLRSSRLFCRRCHTSCAVGFLVF